MKEFLKELTYFTKAHLSYLIDNVVHLSIDKSYHYIGEYHITLSPEKSFKWDDIKDDFLPFIYLLKNKYYLQDSMVVVLGTKELALEYNINNIDNIEITYSDISVLTIWVREKTY